MDFKSKEEKLIKNAEEICKTMFISNSPLDCLKQFSKITELIIKNASIETIIQYGLRIEIVIKSCEKTISPKLIELLKHGETWSIDAIFKRKLLKYVEPEKFKTKFKEIDNRAWFKF